MFSEVVARHIERLGGVWDKKSMTLPEALSSLNFEAPLFTLEGFNGSVSPAEVNQFLEAAGGLRENYPKAFRGAWSGFVEDNCRSWHFRWMSSYSPFGPEAWADHGDEHEMRALMQRLNTHDYPGPEDPLDFLVFAYSTGFPDHWMISLGDPDPSNPTVYETDHEEWFSHLDSDGDLAGFFEKLRTAAEIFDDFTAPKT